MQCFSACSKYSSRPQVSTSDLHLQESHAHRGRCTLAWPDACHVKPLWHHISKFKTRFSHHFLNLAAIWTPGRFIQLCLLATHDHREKKGLSVPKLQKYLELNMSCWQISTHPFFIPALSARADRYIYNIIHIKSNNRIKPALLHTHYIHQRASALISKTKTQRQMQK